MNEGLRRAAAAAFALLVLGGASACGPERPKQPGPASPPPTAAVGEPTAVATDWIAAARERMVKQQIEARGITAKPILEAMAKVPRHEFVPAAGREHAYEDHPVPIGHKQTISQPYVVAMMTDLANVGESSRVLEIGTGSGYQAAVLAEIAAEVYTVEILEPLGKRAAETLKALGYANVHPRIGDGYRGWPEKAPFDAIMVTAAPPRVPEPLKEQLAVGGVMVIPVGDDYQELRVVTRTAAGYQERTVFPVRFVPMTGEVQGPP